MRNEAMPDSLFELGRIASISATAPVMQAEMMYSIRRTAVMKEPIPQLLGVSAFVTSLKAMEALRAEAQQMSMLLSDYEDDITPGNISLHN